MMITTTWPRVRVKDVLGGDPDLVWISRWVELEPSEDPVERTGVSRRPEQLPSALFGWGVAARFGARGVSRLSDLGRQWDEWLVANPDQVRHAFITSTFAPDSVEESVLVVPRVLALYFPDRTVVQAQEESEIANLKSQLGRPLGEVAAVVELLPDEVSLAQYASMVEQALQLIADETLRKVVLGREVGVRVDQLSRAALVAALRAQSLNTWVFHIDGMVGATPELYGGAFERRFYSRVLAGSAPPKEAESLLSSAKNLAEHAYAADSVEEAISGYVDLIRHPTGLLRLPNIAHLATEITGDLRDGASLLQVIEAMHPTAAICGTPNDVAARLVFEIEGFDRGRWGAPIGWADASGSGELGLALRCGQVVGDHIRLLAGAGIVAGSDPQAEVAETVNKLRPMFGALGLQ